MIPAPNVSASGTLNYQGWIGEEQLDPDVVTAKVDHMASARQKLFVTFNWNRIPRLNHRVPLAEPISDATVQNITSRVARLNHDFFFRPTLLNTLSLGYNRFRNPNGTPTIDGGWATKLGLLGVPGQTFPGFSFTNGYTPLGNTSYSDQIDQTYFLRDAVTWSHGQHVTKFGAEIRWNQWNDMGLSNTTGSYSFSSLGTGMPGVSTSGDGFASFLLGEVSSGSLSYPSNSGTRKSYFGFFVHDDWKITSALTLNLGLRFEFEPVPYEANDRQSIVDLNAPNPAAGNLPGAMVFAGSGAGRTGSRTLATNDYSGIGPRFGFAWRLPRKTVMRGGYGIYYSNNYLGVSTSGFNVSASFATLDNGVNPAFRLREGFPQNFAHEPKVDSGLLNGQNGSYLEPSAASMPRTQNWSFGFQHEISQNLLLEALYIANHSTRQVEPQIININQLPTQYLSLGNLLTNSITSQVARDAGYKLPYPGFTGSIAQALRQYPQYRTMSASNAKSGKAMYHAMQIRLEKRLSRGLSYDVSYTLSKNIGYNNPSYGGRGGAYGLSSSILQDNWNRGLERAILPYDMPHAVVIHSAYDLPLKGKGWTARLVEGWSVSAIQRYQAGNPIPIFMQNTLPIFSQALRPDRVPGASASTHLSAAGFNPTTDRLINPAAFAAPAPFRLGTSAPYIQDLRNFTVMSEDFSLIKRTRVTERVSTEFVTQFINIFNRHRFGGMDPNFSNSTFGRATVASFPRFIQLGARIRF